MTSRTLFAAAFFIALTGAAQAHHGWTGQEDKVTELTGTVVKSVSLAGAHGSMKIKVGNVVWDVTLAPPARTARAGLTEDIIPMGATVTVRGNKSTEPGHREMKTISVRWNNTNFNVYPDRQ